MRGTRTQVHLINNTPNPPLELLIHGKYIQFKETLDHFRDNCEKKRSLRKVVLQLNDFDRFGSLRVFK